MRIGSFLAKGSLGDGRGDEKWLLAMSTCFLATVSVSFLVFRVLGK